MKSLLKLLPVLAFAGLTTGCEAVVDDLNVDPNNFQDISTGLLINHSVLQLASIQEAEPARIAGMWADQFGGTDRQYITQDNYGVADADFNATWNELYRDGLTQVLIAQRKAQAAEQPQIVGITEILQAYYGAEAALLFGDVPFDEVNDPENRDPAYQPQREVLMRAIGLLDSGRGKARNALDMPFPISFQNTVLSSSSNLNQFALALKARYLLAMEDYDGALEAANAAGFTEVSNDVNIIHTTDNFSENLFYQFEAEQRSDYLTFTGSSLYEILQPADSTDRSRADDKTDDSARWAFYSFTNDFIRLNTRDGGLFAADADFPVISVPEVQAIRAEAAARTGDEDQAIEALNVARNYWDTRLGTDNYEDYDGDDFDDDDSLLRAILTEKYVSVFGPGTLHDVIRTDNLIDIDLDGRSTPAQRFLYPATEESANSSFPGAKTLDDPTPINM